MEKDPINLLNIYNDTTISIQLDAAIKAQAKWASIISGIGIDTGSSNCSLCQIVFDCKSCSYKTLYGSCDSNNAYYHWNRHMINVHEKYWRRRFENKRMIFCPKCRELAQAVYNELIELGKTLFNEESRRSSLAYLKK